MRLFKVEFKLCIFYVLLIILIHHNYFDIISVWLFS